MSTKHAAHPSSLSIGTGGMAAIALVLLSIAIVAWSTLDVLGAFFVKTPASILATEQGGNPAEDRLAQHVLQFNGRTMFFTPAAPPPLPKPRPEVIDTGAQPDPAPTRYGGPSIIGMANDTVWFSDKRQASIGGEASGDLRVISNNGAWSVVVEWQGIEFDVPFMSHDKLILPPVVGASPSNVKLMNEVAAAPGDGGSGTEEKNPEPGIEEKQSDAGLQESTQPGDEN